MDVAGNHVVKLCIEGIRAEFKGNAEEALRLYERAWEARTDDFEACVAAHYLARQQQSVEEMLRWNRIALEHAGKVADQRVYGFHPSLYLNIARTCEVMGNRDEANHYYNMAAAGLGALPNDAYGEMVRNGIEEGQRRTGCLGSGGSGLHYEEGKI